MLSVRMPVNRHTDSLVRIDLLYRSSILSEIPTLDRSGIGGAGKGSAFGRGPLDISEALGISLVLMEALKIQDTPSALGGTKVPESKCCVLAG